MPSLAVLIPVLARPHNVAPLVDSLELSVAADRAEGWDVHAIFVCTVGDAAEIAAVRRAGYEPLFCSGGYAAKINYAAHFCETVDWYPAHGSDWYLTGADDLRFHAGWLRAAISRHIATGCSVIGTNDMHNPSVKSGHYATHLLVHRDYVARGTIDEPGKILHEGYAHNCCDTELVETAKVRLEFAFARDSHVEHLHPIFKGAPDDAVYRLGREHHAEDRALIAKRRMLWTRTGVQRRRLRARPAMR